MKNWTEPRSLRDPRAFPGWTPRHGSLHYNAMSIELLPHPALAPEPAPPAPGPTEGQTLTLQLRIRHPGAEPMTGTIHVAADAPAPLRAEVVQADASALTLTF